MVNNMVKPKRYVGIKVNTQEYERLKQIASKCKDLQLTVSEIVRVILKTFFTINKPPKDLEKIRSLVIMERKGILKDVLTED